MFDITLDKQADKFLRKCEQNLFDRIVKKMEELRINPVPHNSKRVQGYNEPTFRIRIGDYRTLYRVNHEEKRIVVVKINKREKVY
jgi:mRNA interferase RelE/StbE